MTRSSVAGVGGPNLVSEALAALRAAGWDAPPVRVKIDKRIPVAAGMGGGSADAAAMLRHAPRLAPVTMETVAEIAAAVGVRRAQPARPGTQPRYRRRGGREAGARGSGPRPARASRSRSGCRPPTSTARPTGSASRALRPSWRRRRSDLEAVLDVAETAPGPLPGRLVVNDLQPAALSLRPEIAEALDAALEQGADEAIVCGSGPTVIGVFWGDDGLDRARLGVAAPAGAVPGGDELEARRAEGCRPGRRTSERFPQFA